jgi:uncharacterized protein YjbJ (UPF0337 family)
MTCVGHGLAGVTQQTKRGARHYGRAALTDGEGAPPVEGAKHRGSSRGSSRLLALPPENSYGGATVNEHTMKGDWKILRGRIRERWGKLTDDELDVIEGRRDQLAGLLQKQYGETKEDVERQIREFEDRHSRV